MEIQCTLFDPATEDEIRQVKRMLVQYKQDKTKLRAFESNPPDTCKQQEIIARIQRNQRNICRAIQCIHDDEVRCLMEYRFIAGHPRKAALIKFDYLRVVDRTIDRMVEEGIRIVAENLKLWGEI